MVRSIDFFGFVCVLSLSVLSFSCSEEAPQKNVTPSITINSPSVNDLLKKTFLIEAEVIQPEFSYAEIFLADVLIGESEESTIKISFDTKQFNDGVHELKIVATDKKGNTIETSLEVEVLNTLLTFSIPENYIRENVSMWFFISDYNGTLLGVQKCNNNTTVSFETPQNYSKGQPFILHQCKVGPRPSTSGTSTLIQSYADMKPGSYWYKPVVNPSSSPAGHYQVIVNNVSTSFDRLELFGEFGAGGGSSYAGTYNYQVDMPNHNSGVFCLFTNNSNNNIVPRYKYVENAIAGQSITLDFQNFTEMNQIAISFDSQMDAVSTVLWSYDKNKIFNSVLDIYSQTNTSNLNLYYPGTTFSDYLTTIWASKGNRSNKYSKIGTIPDSFKVLNATVSSIVLSEGNLIINSTGDFDIMKIESYDTWTTVNENSLTWQIFMNDDNKKQFKMIALPSEILSEHPELSGRTQHFNRAELTESNGYETYQDYIRYTLQANENPYEYTEITSSTITGF